tara:strand:- start:229 stop:429 length:201 start_codon:yes stop_codon:yes gene_type:complete
MEDYPMAKSTELFFNDEWIKMAEGFEAFKTAKSEGFPIRIVHPSGSFKVIHNSEALPEGAELRHKA